MLVGYKSIIEQHIIDYYQTLFVTDTLVSPNISLKKSVVPFLVSKEENNSLLRCLSLDEVKNTVFHMDAHSAPGPDGFTCIFIRLTGMSINMMFML